MSDNMPSLTVAQFGNVLRVRVPTKLKALTARVYADAVMQLYTAIALGTPVYSGYLRAGLGATTAGGGAVPSLPPRMNRPPRYAYQGLFAAADDQVISAIAVAARSQASIMLGFQAPYAPYVEERRHMVKAASGQWGHMLAVAVANARAV